MVVMVSERQLYRKLEATKFDFGIVRSPFEDFNVCLVCLKFTADEVVRFGRYVDSQTGASSLIYLVSF